MGLIETTKDLPWNKNPAHHGLAASAPPWWLVVGQGRHAGEECTRRFQAQSMYGAQAMFEREYPDLTVVCVAREEYRRD